jgi:hypothetical protein
MKLLVEYDPRDAELKNAEVTDPVSAWFTVMTFPDRAVTVVLAGMPVPVIVIPWTMPCIPVASVTVIRY